MMRKKKIKFIDTITNDNISYVGNVSIKYFKDGKRKSLKAHNSGKISLFTLMTKLIAGELTGIENYLPYYIMCCNKSGETITELLESPIFIATSPTRLDDNGNATLGNSKKVQLQFVIRQNSILNSSTSINYLKLLNSKEEVCADIDLIQSISDVNSNILIAWTLEFDNKQ